MNRNQGHTSEVQQNDSASNMLAEIITLQKAGKLKEAETLYQKLLTTDSDDAAVLATIGSIELELRRFENSLKWYTKIIAIEPQNAGAYYHRAMALANLQRFAEAIADFDKAIALTPNDSQLHHYRGLALHNLNLYEGALESYSQAIALNPHNAEVLCNYGVTLNVLNKYDEALAYFDKAIALNATHINAHYNRGFALEHLRRYDEAIASYDNTIALQPDHIDSHWNKSLLQLLLGNYAEGWKSYEWRWKKLVAHAIPQASNKPLWQGHESLQGKTILLYGEQGFGDILQFCRYVPVINNLGAKVVLGVEDSLIELMSSLKGQPILIGKGTHNISVDFHCPLMSLPLALRTTLETIPSEPYLSASTAYIDKWRPLLEEKLDKKALRIGLCWAGGIRPDHPEAQRIDAIRSLHFSQLKSLLDIENTAFVSLQLGPPKDQLDDRRVLDISSQLKNWADTAAVISLLDLVITVDTSVVHLAGALGKKTWMLNRYDTCWRWLLDRDDSPWYPSLTQFRQPKPGDWESVIANVKAALVSYPKS